VGRRGAVHAPLRAERILKTVAGERHACRIDERQLVADPLAGDEEPVICDLPSCDGLETAPEGAERGDAGLVAPAKLEPGVAEPLGMWMLAAEQQVPFHPLARIGVGLDAMRRELAVEQERQRHRQHLRLPRAVVAAEQQPSVAEPELLLVVVEDVDQSGAKRLPARAFGLRQRAAHAWLVPSSVGSSTA
jgi:hypothetical protein